jgi:TPR repeat protein
MKRVSTILLLTTLIVLCGVSLFAAESTRALKARARDYYYGSGGEQNYAKALQLYLQAADLGDAEAQYVSGGMLFKGMGAPKDINRAFRLLYQAAVNGQSSAVSEQLVGQGFLLGAGLPKNYAKAIDWYTKAADNGNTEAQNELGFLYFIGKGVEQDIEKGGAYFLMAARGGLPVAQYNVGIMYATGRGVEGVDIGKAYAWLNIAATSGHRPAKAARDYLETIIDKDQLGEAQRLAEELLKTLPR